MEQLVGLATANTMVEPITRRAALKALSGEMKAVARENDMSLNAVLLYHYAEQTGQAVQDFKTLSAWNAEGYSVKKGERAFGIWGKRTKKTVNVEEGRIAGEPEVIEYYPYVGLFHAAQVVKRSESGANGGRNERNESKQVVPTVEKQKGKKGRVPAHA